MRTQRRRPHLHDRASGGSSSLHFPHPPVGRYLGIRGRDTERPEGSLVWSHALLTPLPIVLNLLLAALPRKATAATITIAISATIRAYSTAVAPLSSRARTRRSLHQAATPV